MTPQREEALRLLRLARRDQETFDLLYPLPRPAWLPWDLTPNKPSKNL